MVSLLPYFVFYFCSSFNHKVDLKWNMQYCYEQLFSFVSIFSKAYSHACITKEEKDTSLFSMVLSICSINGKGKRIVLFSVSFLFGLS